MSKFFTYDFLKQTTTEKLIILAEEIERLKATPPFYVGGPYVLDEGEDTYTIMNYEGEEMASTTDKEHAKTIVQALLANQEEV